MVIGRTTYHDGGRASGAGEGVHCVWGEADRNRDEELEDSPAGHK